MWFRGQRKEESLCFTKPHTAQPTQLLAVVWRFVKHERLAPNGFHASMRRIRKQKVWP